MICQNPNCNTSLKYHVTLKKGETLIRVYHCPKCGEDYDIRFYMYMPRDCPKHHWIFDRWNFRDNGDTHEIFWVMKCDRCGLTREDIRWDSHAVGLRQCVELENPKVLNLLDLNEQTARFHLPADDVVDFWKH